MTCLYNRVKSDSYSSLRQWWMLDERLQIKQLENVLHTVIFLKDRGPWKIKQRQIISLLSSKCTCVCVRMCVWCWGSVCCVSVPAVISWKVGGSEVSARLQSSWTHLTSLTWAAAKLSPQWDTGSTHSVVVLFLCHLYPTFKYICIYYLQYIHSHKYVYTQVYVYKYIHINYIVIQFLYLTKSEWMCRITTDLVIIRVFYQNLEVGEYGPWTEATPPASTLPPPPKPSG